MKKILIINSNYYKNISKNLVASAIKELSKDKLSISIIDVPGIFEIPITIKKNIKKFDGFIALGCVIKGETPHFDLICSSTFNSIMRLSIDYSKPIGNGVITALNNNQAIERSKSFKSSKPNKGKEAANAVLFILKNEPKKI
jgi:6,7-dimethyl-8-ribityllumazine synthase|tara:strand:+ start:114 stop:539 length:426 start_codon:yes stop_codon:yes gene_type:complete